MVPAADYHRDRLSQFDKFFGVVGDVSVDTKATSYISSVQERFKLENKSYSKCGRQASPRSRETHFYLI